MVKTHNSFRNKTAFTLIELLVVIGIVVLLLAMAVPLMGTLTGKRSVEGAYNQVSAALGAARAESMQLQHYGGILFYHDIASDRLGIAAVYAEEQDTNGWNLELAPERDSVLLPAGVWCASPAVVNGSNLRYLYPTPIGNGVPIGGVILFDGRGQLISLAYQFHVATGGVKTPLGNLLYPSANPPTDIVKSNASNNFLSQVSTALLPRDGATNPVDPDTFANDNAIPLVVNRYNGTLIKGE